MVHNVEPAAKEVDVFLVTPGGNGHQVNLFVNTLRSRFSSVEFLLPFMAMSAGPLWALSGDRIWMDGRAFIGPIDPQVPLRDGRFVPAQSLLLLPEKVRREGEAAITKGAAVPWHLIAILNGIDKKELGDAIVASKYSITMAATAGSKITPTTRMSPLQRLHTRTS